MRLYRRLVNIRSDGPDFDANGLDIALRRVIRQNSSHVDLDNRHISFQLGDSLLHATIIGRLAIPVKAYTFGHIVIPAATIARGKTAGNPATL